MNYDRSNINKQNQPICNQPLNMYVHLNHLLCLKKKLAREMMLGVVEAEAEAEAWRTESEKFSKKLVTFLQKPL